jgi:hypothetical protein
MRALVLAGGFPQIPLIEELKSLKAAEAFKFHVCDDSKSFDTAIDCAIETIESFVETDND